MALKVKILDTAAGAAIFQELGLMDAAQAALAGDYMSAFNIFYNNLAGILMNKGLSTVISIILKYTVVKAIVNAVPGTGKTFSVLGLVDIEI